ncbi:MAG: hypothetical protein Q7U25_00435, partial [Sulfuricella sp.]|nr:hypothetical protein [Sulfuricella sp.]
AGGAGGACRGECAGGICSAFQIVHQLPTCLAQALAQQARNLQQDLGGQGGVFADDAEKVGLGDDSIPVVVSSLVDVDLVLDDRAHVGALFAFAEQVG